jgi:hypothetical protein
MNFRTAGRLAACAAALLLSSAAQADYLWLQSEGGRATVYAGELGKPLAQLPVLGDARPVLPEGKTLPLETAANHYAFQPQAGDQRFTAVRTADSVLTYLQARLGRAETKPLNELELVPTEPGGNRFQLFFKGRPVAASQVNVETSEGWRRVLTPAQDGTVGFTPWMPGLYVLEVTARVNNGSVTRDGKKYEDVRHTATLSFEVQR